MPSKNKKSSINDSDFLHEKDEKWTKENVMEAAFYTMPTAITPSSFIQNSFFVCLFVCLFCVKILSVVFPTICLSLVFCFFFFVCLLVLFSHSFIPWIIRFRRRKLIFRNNYPCYHCLCNHWFVNIHYYPLHG